MTYFTTLVSTVVLSLVVTSPVASSIDCTPTHALDTCSAPSTTLGVATR